MDGGNSLEPHRRGGSSKYPLSVFLSQNKNNVYPFKPHFYIVKLGFTEVYIIFLILLKNIDCGYSLEPHRRGGSIEYPQSMF